MKSSLGKCFILFDAYGNVANIQPFCSLIWLQKSKHHHVRGCLCSWFVQYIRDTCTNREHISHKFFVKTPLTGIHNAQQSKCMLKQFQHFQFREH